MCLKKAVFFPYQITFFETAVLVRENKMRWSIIKPHIFHKPSMLWKRSRKEKSFFPLSRSSSCLSISNPFQAKEKSRTKFIIEKKYSDKKSVGKFQNKHAIERLEKTNLECMNCVCHISWPKFSGALFLFDPIQKKLSK